MDFVYCKGSIFFFPIFHGNPNWHSVYSKHPKLFGNHCKIQEADPFRNKQILWNTRILHFYNVYTNMLCSLRWHFAAAPLEAVQTQLYEIQPVLLLFSANLLRRILLFLSDAQSRPQNNDSKALRTMPSIIYSMPQGIPVKVQVLSLFHLLQLFED